ncbi:MAG: addiction module antidote protein [Thermoguttaceae bacterium]
MITVHEFDPSRYLDSETKIVEYLAVSAADTNPAVFLRALGNVARARGMTQLAKDAGLERDSLDKVFVPGKKPQFATVLKIVQALGMRLDVRPMTNAGNE